ncbi:peptidoglycan editing factor PgeF [Propionivibrio sp.]|uniref:peptidoglycan editing factor PgeF n=1 Tax=Propionivibrio sp. TaxID=2212460 RepID=UPI003BF32C8D
MSSKEWIVPDWPAPPNVRSLLTTRNGGASSGVYASLNLGSHVGDDPRAVAANRALVSGWVAGEPGCAPVWLEQVHGTRVIDAATWTEGDQAPRADAAFSRQPGVACVVMTADCLPVLFCDDAGTVVAAAHAGWRGLLAGVLEETIAAMGVAGRELMAYLGPAIGPQAFEVGEEVRSAFVRRDGNAATAFKPSESGKWLADIYLLARQRLAGQGIDRAFGGSLCTASEADRFFSYRRDGQSGRMASMIWLDSA